MLSSRGGQGVCNPATEECMALFKGPAYTHGLIRGQGLFHQFQPPPLKGRGWSIRIQVEAISVQGFSSCCQFDSYSRSEV